jgi:hypothetical protein
MPEERWSIIHGGVHRAFADMVVVGDDVMLHEHCRHFEVGVGGAAARVLESDKVIDNVWGEMALPNNRVASGSSSALW